jgi:hypothetical protein
MMTPPLTQQPRTFNSHNLGWLLFLGVFCGACQKSDPGATSQGIPAPSVASAAAVPAPSNQEAAKTTASGCAGRYTGTYAVSPTKAAITQKEGAPAQWEKDDGKGLAGQGEITLEVAADNLISGTVKGPLGEQTLRGSCDETTLRAELDTASGDPTSIKNGVLLAELNGDIANGTLAAATGDSLVRRSGTVSLRKVQ